MFKILFTTTLLFSLEIVSAQEPDKAKMDYSFDYAINLFSYYISEGTFTFTEGPLRKDKKYYTKDVNLLTSDKTANVSLKNTQYFCLSDKKILLHNYIFKTDIEYKNTFAEELDLGKYNDKCQGYFIYWLKLEPKRYSFISEVN